MDGDKNQVKARSFLFGKKFCFVFSLGEDCACAMYLNRHGLRDMSSPFDWLCNATFETRIDLLCNGFENFLDRKNLKWYPWPEKGLADRNHDIYKDEVLGFNFYHDFPVGLELKTSYNDVYDKYSRRIARLDYRLRHTNGDVLAVWWSRDKHIKREVLSSASQKLNSEFGSRIHLLVCENDMAQAELVTERISEKIMRIKGPLVPDINITAGDERINDRIFAKIRVLRNKENRWKVWLRRLARLFSLFAFSKKKRRSIREKVEGRISATSDYIELCENREKFRKMVRGLKDIVSDEDRMKAAHIAALFAIETGTGYYSSREIEDVFVDIGQRHKISIPSEFDCGTCLIVMSEAYHTGGHTRVVERWIEADDKRKYSLVMTRKSPSELPSRLVAAVERSGGRIVELDSETDFIKRGLALRKIAASFETVVLHTHMDDPIPLIAFGSDDFKRPVGFYNHADHRFWLGVCISDVVADYRTWGREITNRYRGVEDSFLLTIPADSSHVEISEKHVARKRLNLPMHAKIVLTVGSDFKYKPMMGIDFLDLVVPLLKNNQSLYVIGIGMTFDYFPEWRRVSKRYGGRLLTLGYVDHDELYDYYAAADLVLDSIPTSGETALTDAVRCGCPVLALSNPTGLMEWTIKSPAYCDSIKTLLAKAFRLLKDEKYANAHVQETYAMLIECSGEKIFKQKLNELYGILLSKTHALKSFLSKSFAFSELDYYHLNVNKRHKTRLKIGRWVHVYKPFGIGKKCYVVDFNGKLRFVVKKGN